MYTTAALYKLALHYCFTLINTDYQPVGVRGALERVCLPSLTLGVGRSAIPKNLQAIQTQKRAN